MWSWKSVALSLVTDTAHLYSFYRKCRRILSLLVVRFMASVSLLSWHDSVTVLFCSMLSSRAGNIGAHCSSGKTQAALQ